MATKKTKLEESFLGSSEIKLDQLKEVDIYKQGNLNRDYRSIVVKETFCKNINSDKLISTDTEAALSFE